jgi:hypothetical protein
MTPQPQHGSNILGISAKSLYPLKKQQDAEQNREGAINAKSLRFDLLRSAQSLLHDGSLSPADQARVCWCHRSIRTQGESLGVFRADEGTGARLSGVTTCGSVWDCPVCSAKITEQRRKELQLAITAWLRLQGEVQFLTLTFPHQAGQALADLMPRFAKALQRFKSSKGYKRVMLDASRAGSIRSLETTWGENGWHPHVHELVFVKRELTMTEVDQLKSDWYRICIKCDLGEQSQKSDMLRRGLDIRDGRYAAEYAAKFGSDWDLAAEMTKPHSKIGRLGQSGDSEHYTPFQLLAWASRGDEKAGALFREFSANFKGKRMLSWSPRLSALLEQQSDELRALAAMEDEDIAALQAVDAPAPTETKVGELHQDQFAVLLSRNRLGDFIAYVARCCFDPNTGQDDIDAYVESIKALPPSHSSRYLKKKFIGSGYLQQHEVH